MKQYYKKMFLKVEDLVMGVKVVAMIAMMVEMNEDFIVAKIKPLKSFLFYLL